MARLSTMLTLARSSTILPRPTEICFGVEVGVCPAGGDAAALRFNRIGTDTFPPFGGAPNDGGTGKNRKCAAILNVFRRNPTCFTLSSVPHTAYRALVGRTGLRGRQFVYRF